MANRSRKTVHLTVKRASRVATSLYVYVATTTTASSAQLFVSADEDSAKEKKEDGYDNDDDDLWETRSFPAVDAERRRHQRVADDRFRTGPAVR